MKARMRYWIFIIPLLLLFAGVTPAGAGILVQCPPDTTGPGGVGPPDGVSDVADAKCMHLSSGDGFTVMADGKDQYIFSFSTIDPGTAIENVVPDYTGRAMFPAPTITLEEGQELFLSLTNVGMIMRPDLFDAHSVHWHGFINAATVFDGVPEVSPSSNMLATQPYYYMAAKEGTFFYHCHVEAAEHMQMGMIGNLWVYPEQDQIGYGGDPNTIAERMGGPDTNPWGYAYNDGDGSTAYDVEYPIQMTTFDSAFHDASLAVQPLPFALMQDNYFMINGRGYPDTINTGLITNNAMNWYGSDYDAQTMNALITATAGQKILLRLSNVSTTDLLAVTTTLGVPMRVVARGAELLRGPTGEDLSFEVDVLNIGGGQAFDVILNTTGVPAGTYFLYTTNLQFLSNDAEERGGIMTEIVIN